MNLGKYIFKNIVVWLSIISSLFVLISSCSIVFVSDKYIKAAETDMLALNKFYLIALGFALFSLVVEIFVLYRVVRLRFAKAEKTVVLACLKENVKLPKTGINEIDLLLAKLKAEAKGIAARFCEINGTDSKIIGVFEIDKAKKRALVNEAMLSVLDIDKAKKENGVFGFMAEDYDDFIKNIQKFAYPREDNLFLIDLKNKKTWLKAYVSENDSYAVGFFTDETDRMEKNFTDLQSKDGNSFTNMFSRETFIAKVEKEMRENPKAVGCFATIELDGLKIINDTYGHKIGDMYIQAAEKAMVSQAKGCIFGKKSGYEFLFFYYDYVSRNEIREKIENWISVLDNEKFIAPDKREYKFKITAGYCFFPEDGNNAEKLMRYSSYAIYEARTMFYGSVHAFSMEAYNRAAFIEKRVEKFHKIIENNLIEYVFQPIISLSNGSVFGYEALMRSKGSELKLPGEILEIAKSENMQYAIEKLTTYNCLEIVDKNRELFKNKRLFYNTIFSQMLTADEVERAMEKYSEIGYCLIPEIPEIPENMEVSHFYKKCASIKDNGDKIAIDKFTGKFVDINDLFKIDPNYIKIDCSLVRDINLKRDSQTFVNKLVKYAKEKRITTIAVGVETYDELRALIKLEVDLAQGFYIARPKEELVRSISADVLNEIEEINSYI